MPTNRLQLFLFGGMRICHADRPAETKLTRIPQVLLAYLLLDRHHSLTREVLAAQLWGDYSEEQARGCLSTALWRLRYVLEPPGVPRGAYLLTGAQGEIGFNWESDHWLDVTAFEQQTARAIACAAVLRPDEAQELERALNLYTGDLLEGFYDDWTLRERERLRCLYLSGQACLMEYYKNRRAYDQSLACAQRILACDPLREEIHRDVMRLYMERGQRTLAIRQYETCQAILAEEMSIAPMPETQALYAQIIGAAGNSHSLPDAEPVNLNQALLELRTAIRTFDEGQAQLQRAIQLVEALMEQRNA